MSVIQTAKTMTPIQAEQGEVEPRDVAHDRDDREAGVRPYRRIGELEREHREGRGDHDLAGDLRPAAEAEAALVAGLQEVVDEADRARGRP